MWTGIQVSPRAPSYLELSDAASTSGSKKKKSDVEFNPRKPPKLWEPFPDEDFNAWRSINFDENRTIYSMQLTPLASILDLEAEPSTERIAALDETSFEIDNLKERDYISHSLRLRKLPPINKSLLNAKKEYATKTIWDQKDQFFMPTKHRRKMSLTSSLKSLNTMRVLKKTKTNTIEKQILPGLKCLKPRCDTEQFCDVLGHTTCTTCVESINKERAKLDEDKLECPSMTSVDLVGPALACTLSMNPKLWGNFKLSRKKNRALPPLLAAKQ